MSQLDIKEVQALLDSVANADINELVLETGDYKLTVKRGQEVQMVEMPAAPTIQAQQVAPAALAAPSPSEAASPAASEAQPDAPAAVVTAEPAAAPAASANLKEVNAPIVGTFYAAASPDAAPFVKEGDRVQVGQVLCIIEAMKLMNEIEAEVAGTVVEICVRNEEPVEYGQVLFTIEPS